MNQNRSMPVPGEFYRHFKNKMYQIITVASHSETGEAMVVYQALYGEFKVWTRPLDMFMEEVDRGKYPQAKQKYRFERVRPKVLRDRPESRSYGAKWDGPEWEAYGPEPGTGGPAGVFGMDTAVLEEPAVNPYLLDFLDALDSRNYDKKLECLARLAGHVTQKELDAIYTVMDMQSRGETVEEQLAQIRRQLMILKKFDGERLR